MATISERLRQIMSIRNVKQAEIIEMTGMNKGALSSYLSGRYMPKQDNIYKLAKALDVNPAWLMGLDVPMEAPQDPIDYEDDKVKQALIMYNAYANASPDVRQAVEILLRSTQEIPHLKAGDSKSVFEIPHLRKDNE